MRPKIAVKGRSKGNAKGRSTARAVLRVQRVLPLGNAWVVKADKEKEFTMITTRLSEAVKIATSLAKHENARLVIHDKNGGVKKELSFVSRNKV